MTAQAPVVHHASSDTSGDPVRARGNLLLGVKLAILSEVMLFGALFAAYFVIRSDGPAWPPLEGIERPDLLLPGLNTLLLVSSSITMQLGVRSATRGDARLLRWLTITLILGTVFLVIQAYEFMTNGFGLTDGVFGSTFYTLTGFHGAHVFAGLVLIAIVANRARRGLISRDRHVAVEAASFYWHFVDVVWLFLFSTIYVL